MSAASEGSSKFPTMIIPQGTEIKVNSQGQLSIKTPGNLVIQNSGNYSELESTNGSIRIEDNVNVEAVSVKAAEACYIQGTLTAWRVTAKKIALEDRAKAYIMMQDSQQLELSRTSRLVGNFANEKEIYLMLGKFTDQLRQLPGNVDLHATQSVEAPRPASSGSLPGFASTAAGAPALPSPLDQALSLLEAEVRRPELDNRSSEAIREVIFALRERDLQRAGLIYRDAFTELSTPSEELRRAYDMLATYFRSNRL
ncbi:MAG: hypothetical protein ABI718_17385 [Acidobacteriota bacterium]